MILLLDLSHAGFAAVLDADGSRMLASSARPAGTRHDDVAAWTESLLARAGATFADLTEIAVGVGPGSFTGIRIAMAFAQGLALPRGLPVHGFTSFEALFLSRPAEPGAPPALAAIPANAGRFYVAESLEDAGALIAGEELAARIGGAGKSPGVILASEETPALTTLAATRARVWTPGEDWNATAIARHARATGRGLARPMYLQLSAAEEKFGAADVEGSNV